jgi:hypothetical protein
MAGRIVKARFSPPSLLKSSMLFSLNIDQSSLPTRLEMDTSVARISGAHRRSHPRRTLRGGKRRTAKKSQRFTGLIWRNKQGYAQASSRHKTRMGARFWRTARCFHQELRLSIGPKT